MSATENAIPTESTCLAARVHDEATPLHASAGVGDRWSLGLAEPRPAWPPRLPAIPADEYYADLSRRLATAERPSNSMWAAIQAVGRRILDLVRPNAFDVDAFVCGSFAARTQLPSSRFEIDVVLRFSEPRPRWAEVEREAPEEIANWLRCSLTVTNISRWSLSVPVDERIELHLLPAWRADDGGALVASSPEGHPNAIRFDPAGHRDLLIARQASLGPETPFTALIRIVKLLNRCWAKRTGNAPLSSYHIDVLALHLCRTPFTLSEGVADFLRDAAEAVRSPLPDPLRIGSAVRPLDQPVAAAVLAEAAKQAEAALMARTGREAEGALHALFADTLDAAERHGFACRAA